MRHTLKIAALVPFLSFVIACSSSAPPTDPVKDADIDALVKTISGECTVIDGGYVCDAGTVVVAP